MEFAQPNAVAYHPMPRPAGSPPPAAPKWWVGDALDREGAKQYLVNEWTQRRIEVKKQADRPSNRIALRHELKRARADVSRLTLLRPTPTTAGLLASPRRVPPRLTPSRLTPSHLTPSHLTLAPLAG